MIRIKKTKATEEKIRIGVAASASEAQKTWVEDPKLLMATVRGLERDHVGRCNENRKYQRLYYAKPYMTGASALSDADGYKMYDSLRRHGANLTAEVIDAGVSLLCRRLQAKVEPVGGDAKFHAACKRLGRVCDGIAESSELMTEFTEVVRAGMVNDTGFALVDVDKTTGDVKGWKLDQNYVFWPLDSTRIPRTVVIVLPIPKPKLISDFPEHEDAIRKLPTWRPRRVVGVDDMGGSNDTVDTVAVAIGWSLAISEDKPGQKVWMAGDILLEKEDYKLDIHQVVKFSWKANANGWGGVALARTVAPYDLTNKRLLSRTLSALDGAVPWLLTEEENDIEAVSDIDYQRVTFPRGSQPPQVIVPNPVSTQSLDRMEANRAAAFREAHINENAAQGQAPAGLKSAVAQFAWADAVQTVLLPQQEGWQRLWRDFAHIVVALMQTNKKARIRVGGILQDVELPKLSKDKYRISFGLVSGLSLTVSGRLEQLSQIQAALPNKLDNEDVLRHIGLPDTQALADRLLGPRELAEYIVQRALEDGHVETPPRMLGADGLGALYRIASQEYCCALKKPHDFYQPTHLEALRKVILITEFLQKSPLAPAAVVAPAAPVPLPTVPGLTNPATGATAPLPSQMTQ